MGAADRWPDIILDQFVQQHLAVGPVAQPRRCVDMPRMAGVDKAAAP